MPIPNAIWTAPTCQVVDPEAPPFGYYGASREIAMARKNTDKGTIWYCALPLRAPAVMREIFRQGGVHVYDENNEVLHAGGNVLWIHSENGDLRRIFLRNNKKLRRELEPWSTVIPAVETGGHLLQ